MSAKNSRVYMKASQKVAVEGARKDGRLTRNSRECFPNQPALMGVLDYLQYCHIPLPSVECVSTRSRIES